MDVIPDPNFERDTILTSIWSLRLPETLPSPTTNKWNKKKQRKNTTAASSHAPTKKHDLI